MTDVIATRTGTFAQRSFLVQQMMDLQARVYDSQLRVTTEQKSQNYTGISSESFRLVNLESEVSEVEYFTKSNNIAQVRLNTVSNSVSAIESVLHRVHDDLLALNAGDQQQPLEADEVSAIEDIQEFAFAAMQDLSSYLNARSDGRYVFSGGRTDQKAVDFPYGNLAEFQADYDGATVTFPTSRAANVPDVKIANAQHGGLTFGANTITPTTAASTASLTAGTVIELSDGDITTQRFTVTARNSTTGALTVTPDPSGLPAAASDATITGVSYYGGDSLSFEHRVSENRTLDLGLNAKDPAFEKAFRALGMLAQGGLDAASTTTAAGATGTLTFDDVAGTVTAANGGSLQGLPIGSAITFPGTANNAAQTFTIVSNDGTTLELDPPPTAEGPVASEAVTDNLGRIDKALKLLYDAIDHDSNLSGEMASDIGAVARQVGFNQVTLDRALDEARTTSTYLSIRVSDIERVDLVEAATRLQDDALALEASMSSYARISSISLMSYL
ncbi:flagellin [Roseospira navarrensis]|uniref:Flagellin n=1 Tax=Roseospira navarrensis TaxID=140058 RepID=A0A7X2D2X8_9PROT|nr:flagellin [Roseospira navarrensis]MQX35002.1 hypothetical protein [Roseospira navarrensis]